MEFEWDEAKAVENMRKHGVNFPQAALAFRDLLAVELFDDRRNSAKTDSSTLEVVKDT